MSAPPEAPRHARAAGLPVKGLLDAIDSAILIIDRHEVLIALIPEEVPHRPPEDRQVLHPGHPQGRKQRGDRIGDLWNGPQPQPGSGGGGVQTEEQVALLRDHGCDFFQGRFFCEPTPCGREPHCS